MIKKIVGILCMGIGLLMFLYPTVNEILNKVQSDRYIESYEEAAYKEDSFLEVCREYNTNLITSGQAEFKDAWSVKQPQLELKDYDRDDFGYISIPKMDVELPLYLGATEKNMSKGAVILGGTSLPIGGESTNCVIAAHRGYQGIPFFREIEKLEPGDKVEITNPWETLKYVVTEIKIINPTDSDEVKIQPEKDMVTLITCHPYRSHGKKRYVVYCERDVGQTVTAKKPNITDSSITDIAMEKWIRRIGVAIILLITVRMIIKKRKQLSCNK